MVAVSEQTLGPGKPSPGSPLTPGGPLGPSVPYAIIKIGGLSIQDVLQPHMYVT